MLLGEGEAPPSPACEYGTMLQCRTVLASVPKCGNPEGLKTDQDLAPLSAKTGTSLFPLPIFPEPPL